MTTATAQKVSLGFGIFYLLIGVLGFIPGITVMDAGGHGLLLGIFAVNALHNMVHLAAGAPLVLAGTSAANVFTINRVLTIVFALLVPASLIAPLAEGVAINAPDTALHLGSALLTGYIGFVASRQPAMARA